MMKTLLESILLELKLSKAKTGNKLDFEPTFGELKKGDKVYIWFSANKSMDETEFKIITIETFPSPELRGLITDKNPDKEESVYCKDIIKVKNTKTGGTAIVVVPHNVTYSTKVTKNSDYFVCATNYNTFLDCCEKNKLIKV